ncbi:hypothetical protein Tco_1477291, partial [Tanacetum coccineum]
SSAKSEYHGVANVVAETAWIRNLLRELHTPLFTATLVYCDNVKGGFQPERLAQGLESVSVRRIQGLGYGVLDVSWSRDHAQIRRILLDGYGVLIMFPSWSLVSAGTDTPYLT